MTWRILCLGLGGTKFQFGVLDGQHNFFSNPEIHWRSEPRYACLIQDSDSTNFCKQLILDLTKFIQSLDLKWSDIKVLGIPFPGPCCDGRWYSNNLSLAFRQGVFLEKLIVQCLTEKNYAIPNINIKLDSKCDAGGEINHPEGALSLDTEYASVINIATGIAAGFVRSGSVITTSHDFQKYIGEDYDDGAGQLGRHLWFDVLKQDWQYRFTPQGELPADKSGERLTDRLSGPALAGRLLKTISKWDVPVDFDSKIITAINLDVIDSVTKLTSEIRLLPRETVVSILDWANTNLEANDIAGQCVQTFCKEIADELGSVIQSWLSYPEWKPFGHHIVLTGGVGINFFDSNSLFITELKKSLPSSIISRSKLKNAVKREAYSFISTQKIF